MTQMIQDPPSSPAAPAFQKPALAGTEGFPQWFLDRRQAAWEAFAALPMPRRTDEPWRFSDLKQIDLEDHVVRPADDDSPAPARTRHTIKDPMVRLVFVDGRLVTQEGEPVDGLEVLPLDRALREQPGLVEKHFMRFETPLGSEKFAALHLAQLTNGVFIHASKGVVCPKPIEIIQYFSGDGVAWFPHTLVVGEELSEVTVVEHLLTTSPDDRVFLAGVNDLAAARGARVKYAALQRLSGKSKAILVNDTSAERDADAKSLIVNTGGAWVRHECVSHVTGEGANVNLLSASLPGQRQAYDQRTYQIHRAQHTTSDLLYKNALYDASRSIFSGLIIVDEGAHHTDAYQTCRNLLMSDAAEAHSLPGLEIMADQVKCSHGSTTGQIDAEELFYLMARGLREKLARKLITQGFLEDVLDKFGVEALNASVDAILEDKFRVLV